MQTGVERKMRPFAGNLGVVHIPHAGFYDKGWPQGITTARKVHSAWLESCLRVRLSTKGFWRGLKGTGIIGVGRLYATKIFGLTGGVEHFGLISTSVITDTGVTFLRDDWNASAQDYTNFNFHGCGTGTVAEAVGDTGLGTESTTVLNPDSTRATGTRSVPAGNQWRSVGTLTFDGTAAVTEHGIFSQAATGGGTLWDRSMFSGSTINVVNLDSIQFTYTCTLSSGG